jgi:hypothetical protein
VTADAYGDIWGPAAETIAGILDSELPVKEKLRQVLSRGYFTQYASYPSRKFNARVVDWQLDQLKARFGVELADLPPAIDETDVVPAATLIEKSGRTITPDTLRYVLYALGMAEVWRNARFERVIEIGGGYGGFARVLREFHPGCKFWLTDLRESLKCSEMYLQISCPGARVRWLECPDQQEEADFYLIPREAAREVLEGKQFDLAVNIWSFGEMSNDEVGRWLDLLQEHCRVERLMTINSFMSPVTPRAIDRALYGCWLSALDDLWQIMRFEIDPPTHRCPLIQNFPKGIELLAARVEDASAMEGYRETARAAANRVLDEDWVLLASSGASIADLARPERFLTGDQRKPKAAAVSASRLLAVTDYIGHFNLSTRDTMFRLWDDFRVNKGQLSGALLVAYLAMVGKADLAKRCSREELATLRRLDGLLLHEEYEAFLSALSASDGIPYDGRRLTVQQACDLALQFRQYGDPRSAERLWAKVAFAQPAHGDCWFQMARVEEENGNSHLAAVYAAHSVNVGSTEYREEAETLKARFLESLTIGSAMASGVDEAVRACSSYFTGTPAAGLRSLAVWARARAAPELAAALRMAARFYSVNDGATPEIGAVQK